jgi:hypothetical protein
MLQEKIPWLRGNFEDLLETLHVLHDQDVSFMTDVKRIPESVIAEAKASMQRTSVFAYPPPCRAQATQPHRSVAAQRAPVAPHHVVPHQPPSSLPKRTPYPVPNRERAGSLPYKRLMPKLAQPLPWASQNRVQSNASLMHDGSAPVLAGRGHFAALAGKVGSAAAPEGNAPRDGCFTGQRERKQAVQRGVPQPDGASLPSRQPHTDANLAVQSEVRPLIGTHTHSVTQPYSTHEHSQVLGATQTLSATQPYSAANESSQVLAQVRRDGAALMKQALHQDKCSSGRGDGNDEVESTWHP